MLRRPIRLLCLAVLAVLWTSPLGAAFEQRAYVWQRAWTQEFQRGVAEHAGAFAALDVLAAEITWAPAGPDVRRVHPAWSVLRAAGRPVAIVVRIGPSAESWDAGSPATQTVIATCRDALAEARAAGLEPAELQLDFDAASARLTAYRDLLQAVRREVRPPRLTITVLPDWLRRAEFAALVRENDAYVLQVHSLEKPASIDEAYTLCDPARAATWVEQAATLGHPFRIALPTYGYRLIFDDAGKFVALEAERATAARTGDRRTRLAMAEPAPLARFVQQLLAKPPAACEGLVWFRFPHAADELAWSWPTLQAVMAGRVPEPRLVLIHRPGITGSLDLFVQNAGEAAGAPSAFRVTWRDARLLAADGLAGWQLVREGSFSLLLRPPAHGSNGQLRPGDIIGVGWLRFDRPAEIRADALP